MKNDRCTVFCENNESEIIVVRGTTIGELLQYIPLEDKKKYIAAYINNKSKDLNYVINDNLNVHYITYSHFEGCRIYRRTLTFMLYAALKELHPNASLDVQYSVGRGAYFEIEGVDEAFDLSNDLSLKIRELINSDIEISRERLPQYKLDKLYHESGQTDKIELMSSLHHLYYTANRMGKYLGYFYGTLAASTSAINLFDIDKFYKGYVLRVPDRHDINVLEDIHANLKMYDVFSTHKRWMNILDISTIGHINDGIKTGNIADLVKIGEALHEKQMSLLADMIESKTHSGVRLVMISGPSSSGKTTSSYRLSIQLRVLGLDPIIIGMDNYFVNRVCTPLDSKGRYDYECLEAIDLERFNKDINALIAGDEVEIPIYDFISGTRKTEGYKVKLAPNSIIVIEGIHALNPKTTYNIDRDKIFKLYVSAMTTLSIDSLSYVSTTDNRLMRRIVRDYQFRGCSAHDTLKRWGSVREGEEKYIFPYQKEADYQFNSSLFYELGVLKTHIEPLLSDVPQDAMEYSEATRLKSLLEYFQALPSSIVPSTSLLKEFIGGSSFNIK